MKNLKKLEKLKKLDLSKVKGGQSLPYKPSPSTPTCACTSGGCTFTTSTDGTFTPIGQGWYAD